jgi:PAS domain S-box-containing protein
MLSSESTTEPETSEQTIRAVLDATPDAIITIDSDGLIATFSAGAEKMFGYAADEAISQNVALLMPSPYREEHDEYLQLYKKTGKPRVIDRMRELKAQRKDGSKFPIQLSISEIDHSGTFACVIRDISEKRELEDEIVKIATLEQRRIGQELHDDILQNLTGLGLLADNLKESLKVRGDSPEYLLSEKIAAGIAETHTHARLIAKGLVPVPITADELIAALDELARRTEREHGVVCHFEGSTFAPISDDSVALHIFRMAQEAVTNAIQHAQSKQISMQLEDKAREIILRIADDGIGIGAKRSDSTGLGLRIMEHRCGLLGGVFSVAQRPEGGTSVLCRIPKTQSTTSNR